MPKVLIKYSSKLHGSVYSYPEEFQSNEEAYEWIQNHSSCDFASIERIIDGHTVNYGYWHVRLQLEMEIKNEIGIRMDKAKFSKSEPEECKFKCTRSRTVSIPVGTIIYAKLISDYRFVVTRDSTLMDINGNPYFNVGEERPLSGMLWTWEEVTE